MAGTRVLITTASLVFAISCSDDADTPVGETRDASADASRARDATSPGDDSSPASERDAARHDAGRRDAGETSDSGRQDAGEASDSGRQDDEDGGKQVVVSGAATSECAALTTDTCFAADGIRDGVAFSCRTLGNFSRTSFGTPSWSHDCGDEAMQLSAKLQFPVQAPGPIKLEAKPGQESDLKFVVRSFEFGTLNVGTMTQASTNFRGGELNGEVADDGIFTGTLTASWSAPGAGCDSADFYPGPCAEGALKITFRGAAP